VIRGFLLSAAGDTVLRIGENVSQAFSK